jgi:hypothetical protein
LIWLKGGTLRHCLEKAHDLTSMQDAKNAASLSALNTASRGAATVISPAIFKTEFAVQLSVKPAKRERH